MNESTSQVDQGINFLPKWRVSLLVSGLLLVIALALLTFRWLNLSVDFEGGGVWEAPTSQEIAVSEARDALPAEVADAQVQEVSDASGKQLAIKVQAGSDSLAYSEQIRQSLAELTGASIDDVKTEEVGPTWGEKITSQAVRALLLFFVAVAVYLSVTLEWRMAIGALVAVVHDLVLTAGVYSLTGLEVTPATVVALLTILGYSLYDTVVVYDKVKENQVDQSLLGLDNSGLINHSMNQVLMRSINTTITTVIPVLSMLLVGTFFIRAESLTSFALALFIGLLLGTYSSIFVAAPVLMWLRSKAPDVQREEMLEEKRKKAKQSAKKAKVSSSQNVESEIAPRARKKKRK